MRWFARIVALSVLMVAVLAAGARKRPSGGLNYVAADSVVVWGESYNDLRGMALTVDPALKQSAGRAGTTSGSTEHAWRREVEPGFTLSGRDVASPVPVETAVTALGAATRLFAATGDGRYMDAAERLLFNTLLEAVLRRGPATFERHMAAQALVDGTGCIYATDADGIWVNLYTNSTAHICTDRFNIVVDQMTGMPLKGRVKIRLTSLPRNGFRLRLHLRMPGWAGGSIYPEGRYTVVGASPTLPQVFVNGREVPDVHHERGYIVIDRTWNRGDEVLFDLPLTPLLVRETKAGNTADVAIVRGPLLYAIATAAPDATTPINTALTPDENEDGVPLVRGTYKDGTPFAAQPYFLGTGRTWLRLQ